MSAMAEQARSKAKAKVGRMTAPNSGSVDASGWKEPTDMHATEKTGPRPVSRRQFKRGGKVEGTKAKMHAGRKPRASGGGGWKKGAISPEMTAARKERAAGGVTKIDGGLINTDVKAENEKRDGIKHVGGMKRGGRAHKDMGGLALPQAFTPVAREQGGRTMTGNPNNLSSYKPTPPDSGKLNSYVSPKDDDSYFANAPKTASSAHIRKALEQHGMGYSHDPDGTLHAHVRRSDGKIERMPIGNSVAKLKSVLGYKSGGKVHSDAAADKKLIRSEMHKSGCGCAKCSGGRVGKANGGASYGGTRPVGGRMARAKGGKTDWSAVMANRRPLPAKEFDAENAAALAKGHAPMSPEGREGFSAPGRGSRAPTSSRMARAKGGRAKKGMNVNIIIAPSGGAAAPRPPMPMPPPGGPVGLHQAAPPMPPPGAAAPMGPPAGLPPMPRKRGGRTGYPIETGAGGGLARLEKARAYGP